MIKHKKRLANHIRKPLCFVHQMAHVLVVLVMFSVNRITAFKVVADVVGDKS